MLRIGLVSVFVLVLAQPVHAAPWADAMFDDLTKDFGAVPHGTVAMHPFRLVNKTGATLHISSVRVSCGCTSASAMQTSVAPGKDGVIMAQMDTRRFYGTKSVTIYVQFDQPQFEEVRLSVQANSRDDISYSPESINFGKIYRGTAATAQMNISFLAGSATRILDSNCDSNYLTSSFNEIRRESGEVVYQISAKIRADAPVGKWYSDVWVKTNNPAIPKLRVPLSIEIEPALTVSPSNVVMGQIKAGNPFDRKVIVRGAQPFRITKVDGADEQVRVQEDDDEAKLVHVLTVTLSPAAPGALSRTLRVHTDLEAGGEVTFNAQAQVVP